ncbi:MAG: MFS transporter [Nocardioidaceae bacterium]|nr:MFS transporter [Nocardioidaceae bacterium]
MTAARHLRHLLRGQWFRRLFAVRICSQFADGVFQVALASYVFFSPERQPSASAIAATLATVLLPFSVLGPFAGVFLDRWSRRQVLALSNFTRVLLVLFLTGVVASDLEGPLLFGPILACLSVNRFLLAGLSAALPHVVRREDLLTANAVTPTSGTLAAIAGLAVGAGSRLLWDRVGVDSDVAVLALTAMLYAAAGGLALRLPRDLLGPDFDPDRPAVREAARHVVRGLVEGLKHLAERRPAAYGLAAIGAHRFFYGISTISTLLLYRNYFTDDGVFQAELTGLGQVFAATAVGTLVAAAITPAAVRRFGKHAWVGGLFAAAAVTEVVLGVPYTLQTLLPAAFLLGIVAQASKISVDTLVQEQVEDDFRGRVFSFYDTLFNVTFVAAAVVGAFVLPDSGKSYGVLGLVAGGYAVTAVAYRLSVRRAG